MTSDGGISQALDDNGNLTSSGAETRVWDARNRLIGIQTPGQDNWSATYAFDNRINGRSVGVTQTAFLYDDRGQLWAEVDAQTGKPSKVYSYDAVGLWSEAELRDGKLVPSYPLFDGLGSVLAMTDRQNNVKQTWAYDAFGALSYGSADGGFGYTGRWGGYTDPRAGVLNWNRWYLPKAGRWGSRDPIGIFGGLNLYGYVLNRQTLLTDPWGLCHSPEDCIIGRAKDIIRALSPIPLDLVGQGTQLGEKGAEKAAEYAAELARLRALMLKYPKMSSYVRLYERYSRLLHDLGGFFKAIDILQQAKDLEDAEKKFEDCMKTAVTEA